VGSSPSLLSLAQTSSYATARYATAGCERKDKKFYVIKFYTPSTFSIVLRHWLVGNTHIAVAKKQ